MTRTTSSFSGVGGTTIEYDVYEPDGEPVGLLLVAHGLGEHRGRYAHVAARFTPLGLRVVVPDHRGHGKSGGPRADTRDVSDYTTDLDSLRRLTLVEGRPTYLLGHSMGGLIALDYALDHQGDLAALMLSGALVLPGEDQPPWLVAIAKVLGKVVPTLGTLALDPQSVSRDPKVVAAYEADPLNSHTKVKAGMGAALLNRLQTFPDRLPSLTLPLLVMHGEQDKLTNPEGSRLVHRLAGSSDKTLTIYPELFHEIFNEPEQDQVLDDVVAWLRPRMA
jgi:alpha-beta hydrolase superfamily lysophospholipase